MFFPATLRQEVGILRVTLRVYHAAMKTLDLCQPCPHVPRYYQRIQPTFYHPAILIRQDCPQIAL